MSESNAAVEATAAWVDLVAEVVPYDPDPVINAFQAGLTRLAQKADEQYAQLESGGKAALDVADLQGALDAQPIEVRRAFTLLTGDILFNAVDGPRAAASVLSDTLTRLKSRLRERKI